MRKIDTLDYMLDYIEILLQRIPDDNQYKQELLSKYTKYRNMFEKNPRDINIRFFVLKYVTELEAYIKGYSSRPPTYDYEKIPVLLEDKNEDYSDVVNLNEYVDILINNIDNIDTIQDTKSISTLTNHVQEEYSLIKIKNQRLDQKICKALFTLMLAYIRDNNIEEAKKVCDKFDLDMRIYLINYFKPQIESLKQANKYAEAEFIWKYIYGNQPIRENNIELWYFIAKLEGIYDNIENPSSSDNALSVVEKKSIFDGIKHLIFKYKSSIKKIIIRNSRGQCNQSDIAKAIMLICSNNIDDRYELVFRNGITDISFLESENGNNDFNFNQDCLVNVVFPETAQTIKAGAFKNFPCIKTLDMLNTNIVSIEDNAFFNSSVEQIKFPKSLTKIGNSAFENCKCIDSINLKETNVIKIGISAFKSSSIANIYLPNSLESIEPFCFAETNNLKSINLKNTVIKKLHNGVFENSSISHIYFPKTLSSIGCHVFCKCNNLKYLNLARTKINNIENYAFLLSGLSKIIFPKGFNNLKEHVFNGAQNLDFVDLSRTLIKAIKTDTFSNTNIRAIILNPEIYRISSSAFFNCPKLSIIDLSRCSRFTYGVLESTLSNIAKLNNKKINNISAGLYLWQDPLYTLNKNSSYYIYVITPDPCNYL